eukprot:SAG31_NODE_27_length_32731_cov_1443.130393_31_plen_80_part_00
MPLPLVLIAAIVRSKVVTGQLALVVYVVRIVPAYLRRHCLKRRLAGRRHRVSAEIAASSEQRLVRLGRILPMPVEKFLQ